MYKVSYNDAVRDLHGNINVESCEYCIGENYIKKNLITLKRRKKTGTNFLSVLRYLYSLEQRRLSFLSKYCFNISSKILPKTCESVSLNDHL